MSATKKEVTASPERLAIFVEGVFSCLPWEGEPKLLWIGLADQDGHTLSLVSAEIDAASIPQSLERSLAEIPLDEERVNSAALGQAIIEWIGADSIVEWWSWQMVSEELGEFGAPQDGERWIARVSQQELEALQRIIEPWPAGWGTDVRDLRGALGTLPLRIDLPDPPTPYHPAQFALWQRDVWSDWRKRAFPGGGIPVVAFYIPLAQPLPLPHGFVVQTVLNDLSLARVKRVGAAAALTVSLCVIQASDTQSQMASDVSLLFGTVAALLDEPIPEPISADRAMTIVEAFVPISREIDLEEPPEFHEFSDDFEEALSAVRRLQDAYASLVQGPLLLTSLATLPPAIPMWLGRIENAFEMPRRLADGVFFVNKSATRFSIAPPLLEGERLAEVGDALMYRGEASTFAGYASLRREAWNQRHLHGNWRLAALVAAISGEVLLDAFLMHLHWEKGSRPISVAQHFGVDGLSHTRRVLSQYTSLLGGRWRDDGTGAVGLYLENVVRLRHRIVHGGLDPSLDEADRALEAMIALESYLGDLVSSPGVLNRFTRTAIIWCGQRGLEKRSRFTRRVRDLMNDTSEPNWRITFERWRRFVEFGIAGRPPHGADGNDVVLFLLIWADGDLRWLIHDSDAAAATVIPFNQVHAFGVSPEALDGWRRAAAQLEEDVPLRVKVEHARYERSDTAWLWLDDYEVIPDVDIYLPDARDRRTRIRSRGAGPFPFVPV